MQVPHMMSHDVHTSRRDHIVCHYMTMRSRRDKNLVHNLVLVAWWILVEICIWLYNDYSTSRRDLQVLMTCISRLDYNTNDLVDIYKSRLDFVSFCGSRLEKFRPVGWQTSILMVRSLNLHKHTAFISNLPYNYTIKTQIIQPLNIL